MTLGDFWPEPNETSKIRRGVLVRVPLLGDHAQQVQAAGMVRIAAQDRPAMRLGLGQLSELVMPNRLREHVVASRATRRGPARPALARGAALFAVHGRSPGNSRFFANALPDPDLK